MVDAVAPPAPPDGGEARARAAERRGQWVLLYTALGPLGGRFSCLRCAAVALQPDLIEHDPGCPYRVARKPGGGAPDQ